MRGLRRCPYFTKLVEFFFSIYTADLLSHLGKWVGLIKFEAECGHFNTWNVEKPQNNTSEGFKQAIDKNWGPIAKH